MEDSDVVRAALRAILSQNADLEIVGEAVDGSTAVSRIMAAKPDIVLIDIGLPGASGIDVTRQVKNRAANIKVLIFTGNEFDREMFESFAAGADGYVIKRDFQRSALEMAIRGVSQGKCWLDPEMAKRILAFARTHRQSAPASVKEAAVQPLTPQEQSILDGALHSEGTLNVEPSALTALQRFAKTQVEI